MVGYPIPRKANLACSDSCEPSLKAFEQLAVEHCTSDRDLLTRFLAIPPNAKTRALYHSVIQNRRQTLIVE
jgi:hypothetical protein